MNPHYDNTVILLLVADTKVRNYMLRLCSENNYDFFVASDPDKLISVMKRSDSPIAFVDHESVNTYGPRIYSKIHAAGTGCNVILLIDKKHKNLIKEAMELGAYACILSPYAEWEVLTMIRNIFAKKRLKG